MQRDKPAAWAASVFALITVVGELPVPTHAPDDVRHLADDILSRPEFREPPPSIFERAQRWIGDVLGRIFDALAGGSGGAFAWLILVAAFAAAVYALTKFGRSVQRDPVRRATVDVDVAKSSREWRGDALRFEREGQWKEGLRCRYRALVTDLVDAGVLRDVAGRTAGEYRRELASAVPPAASDFAGATELFERAWYGDEPTGPPESEQFAGLAERVLVGARR
jgi:hypothetical protein